MLVRKGNPKEIHTLQDLAKPGIAIGTTDPQMSTLGALSHAIFEDIGIKETIRDQQSIIVTAPTAHELILQMEGHDKLDVALVYEANCQNLESNVETVAIDHPLALATQNIAAARQTRFPALMARLMNEVLSAESKKSFTEHGFHWEAPSSPHP
jgi:molybdate transport system substrate-binding protein